MRSTRDRRPKFAAALAMLRRERGMTQRQVADELSARGHEVRPQAVSGWEAGSYAPDDPDKVSALEDILDAANRLLPLLDLDRHPDSQVTPYDPAGDLAQLMAAWRGELASLREELREERSHRLALEDQVQALQDRLGERQGNPARKPRAPAIPKDAIPPRATTRVTAAKTRRPGR